MLLPVNCAPDRQWLGCSPNATAIRSPGLSDPCLLHRTNRRQHLTEHLSRDHSLSQSTHVSSSRKNALIRRISSDRAQFIISSDSNQPLEQIGEIIAESSEIVEKIDSREASVTLEFAAQVATAASLAEEAAKTRILERIERRKSERSTYLIAAIASSIGFSSLAGGAVIYRFISQMQAGGDVPYLEMFGTFALAVGAAVGMEFWARWAHRALWHASLWHMHESHHRPREGPFELNDIFAIINAGPAILLLAYGFFNHGLIPGLSFGAGLGITLFGMAYMFVHDGLVHRRFPVGPIADVPYLQKVAAAHQLHHADKYEGVPYGLFLGPQELEKVGGLADLEAVLAARRLQAQVKAADSSR